MIIAFQILSYWRVGTGEGQGGALDATCARDKDKLPYIPGRQIRGLFREAITDAIGLKWIEPCEVELFGSRQPVDANPDPNFAYTANAGTLRFENAGFLGAERAALVADRSLISRMFEIKRSTAIDPGTGTAENHSLRSEEVAIPMTLYAEVTGLPSTPDDWQSILSDAAPLIRAIGNGRNRGFGRVIVTCQNGAR